jgi:hypothetical protein
MKKTTLLATSISATLGCSAANAATSDLSLVSVSQRGYGATVTANISSSWNSLTSVDTVLSSRG